MSRKDFELIARVLDTARLAQWPIERIVKEFAVHLAETNPRFNRVRFFRACGFID